MFDTCPSCWNIRSPSRRPSLDTLIYLRPSSVWSGWIRLDGGVRLLGVRLVVSDQVESQRESETTYVRASVVPVPLASQGGFLPTSLGYSRALIRRLAQKYLHDLLPYFRSAIR